MLKIGHRGAKGHAPENTVIGFQKALELGVDAVELDVHLSLDGEIVVIHDETVDRTTNGNGFVNQMTLTNLQKLTIEDKARIPSLIEVLDVIDKKCLVNIELKGKGTAIPVVDLIQKYVSNHQWSYHDFIISSFDWEMLVQAQQRNTYIPIAVLTEEAIEKALAFAKKIKANAINPDYQLLHADNVARIQQEGFQLFPWTVNEFEAIAKMKKWKVDGIISDYPDRL
ncbi:glycerophosphodiester phosphodiesterase family protein [Flavobacterium sp. UMI-01]|uniref:glycerophosphodiester phosphodiesterase n=1 Tax=Flavobacterium sp. UMI-01 TaxID=1441053 RepID=UPI001C7CDD4C|nr:glycerophosphodiester phosphodiesterase family protein [Flavobacterium sp. UMI-01]GIZ09126.1 putative glycerophosphoryl diester phosphodiesterase YhdW [Flavobacterium sp. UMI-01]